MNNRNQNCYLCGVEVREYKLKPNERHPPDELIPDHVPPKGLFPEPRPNNLITVPCCFQCNNKHSGFDERLRMIASMPFDRNKAGQKILDEKVVGGTLAKGRQMHFAEKILASMGTVPERPELIRSQFDAQEFEEGMIRITKGLLFTLHPSFDYRNSTFRAIDIHPQPFDEQLMLIAGMRKQGQYFERGERVFQCWHHIEASLGHSLWMLVFYESFGFFVSHADNRSNA